MEKTQVHPKRCQNDTLWQMVGGGGRGERVKVVLLIVCSTTGIMFPLLLHTGDEVVPINVQFVPGLTMNVNHYQNIILVLLQTESGVYLLWVSLQTVCLCDYIKEEGRPIIFCFMFCNYTTG